MTDFNLTAAERHELFQFTIEQLEAYYAHTKTIKIAPELDVAAIVERVRSINFEQPVAAKAAVQQVLDGLREFAVHTPHPKYFGLYNPRTAFPSILADLITAVYNPQLAAWSHSPFAVEVENYLITEFGKQFGYVPEQIDGVFASGGAEANLTAVLCALNHHFPNFVNEGVIGLKKRPMIYCSAEAHHSVHKAAKCVGLGIASVRDIPVNDDLKMDTNALITALKEDLAAGKQPFMLVGTAGTTGIGIIDNLAALQGIAKDFGLWYHVDAAWGGAAMLVPELAPFFKGIELSDSITCDAHKWLSMPMGTSMFITSQSDILHRTFRITTEYMPKEAHELAITDPFAHSIQWSRRALGIKLYLTLQIFGWEGYRAVIQYQTNIGNYLKTQLQTHGWSVQHDTPLPVLCFTDSRYADDPTFIKTVLERVLAAGKTWLSLYPVRGVSCLRACITNFSTTEREIDELIADLEKARNSIIVR